MTKLQSRHLFTITMTLPPTIEVGETPAGRRRVFAVSGGRFEGDRLKGDVLSHGASDLLLVGTDGASRPKAGVVLRTDDGALILMTYRGVRHASSDVQARIDAGERVSASEYYLRTAPMFETASAQYAWLNKIMSVGVGDRTRDGVSYEVFEIL